MVIGRPSSVLFFAQIVLPSVLGHPVGVRPEARVIPLIGIPLISGSISLLSLFLQQTEHGYDQRAEKKRGDNEYCDVYGHPAITATSVTSCFVRSINGPPVTEIVPPPGQEFHSMKPTPPPSRVSVAVPRRKSRSEERL